MEYRVWITLPGLPVAESDRWEPLIERLEARHGHDLGPVLGWHGDATQVIVSTPADDHPHAAAIAINAVSPILAELGYPSYIDRIEIEPADDRDADPADPAAKPVAAG